MGHPNHLQYNNNSFRDVRKSALLNIPPTPKSLPAMLSRIRDVDPNMRRLVYAPVLEQAENLELAEAQREYIARTGLRDRESSVRAAAVKLIGSWLDALGGDLEKFVKLFNFIIDGHSDNAATMALQSLFESRSDVMASTEFGGKTIYLENQVI